MSSAQSDAEWAVHDREHDEKRLAKMDAQLAAKDAEIAELRACIADLRAVCHESAGKILEHRLAAQQAESERDEARECVGRLYGILRLLYMSAEISPGFWDEALAATPEHLR